MATLWERTPQRLPPAEPLPLRGDSSEGFQGFFSEFCSEKATSSPVFMQQARVCQLPGYRIRSLEGGGISPP